jgi:hypothetical protein
MTGPEYERAWARLDATSSELLTERPGATFTGALARSMSGIWLIDLNHAMYNAQADPDQLPYFLNPMVRDFVTAKAVRRWAHAERDAPDPDTRRRAAQRREDWAGS